MRQPVVSYFRSRSLNRSLTSSTSLSSITSLSTSFRTCIFHHQPYSPSSNTYKRLSFSTLITSAPTSTSDKLNTDNHNHSSPHTNTNTIIQPSSLNFLQQPYTVSCIGAPLNWGQTHQGTDKAPSLLRKSGLYTIIKDIDTDNPWLIEDEGDLPFHTLNTIPNTIDNNNTDSEIYNQHHLHNANLVGQANELLYRQVYKKTLEKKFVLTLGGDHSIALGSIAGLLHAYSSSLRIIWVDAHADINLPETSPSGNIHGMPLAFLFQYINITSSPLYKHYQWLKNIPPLQPSQLVYIGLRDLDKGEKKIIKDKKLRAYTMYDIDKYGIGKIIEMSFDYLYSTKTPGNHSTNILPLHISFDIDAIDPSITPATGTRVPGGLSLREAHYICEASAETGNLVSMDCVEVNPLLSSNPTSTVDTAIQLIGSALGKRIL